MRRLLFVAIALLPAMHSPVYAQNATLKETLEKARQFVNGKMPDSALVYAHRALDMARAQHDTTATIKALGQIGKSWLYKKDAKQAVANYFEALKLAREGRDDDEIAYLYGEVGYVYYMQQQYKEAKEYYYKGLALRRKLGEPKEVASALINISCMCRDRQEYGEAFSSLRQVEALLPNIKDTSIAGYYYTDMGVLFEYAHKLDSAEWYYRKAYEVWKRTGKESEIFRATFNLGYLWVERGDHSKAMPYFLLAKSAAEQYGSGTDIAHVFGTMAESYAALGNYKSAYQYLYRYAEMNDSIARSEFSTQVARLDKEFQAQKNKEIIREQELQLKTANLRIQEQRSTTLLVLLLLLFVVSAGIIAFIMYRFRRRVDKKVEEARARFFANVVHEIRTPLSMIQAPIQLIRERQSDAFISEQLAVAEKSTLRLNELVSQMLDMSKVDAHAYKLQPSVGNMADFLTGIAEQYATAAIDKGQQFMADISPAPGPQLFDRDAVEKVVTNLLSNASKFTPRGGSLGIRATTGRDAGSWTIEVWDNGPGISLHDRQEIFKRFYRAGEHIRSGIKGMGIGLAMVKDLVDLMHGAISVDSEPGQGAVFTVTLPLTFADQPGADGTITEGGHPLILLVEDDADILRFNADMLRNDGYQVATAANGADAITLLANTLPDIVITDLMMPGIDGAALITHIRSHAATEHLPIVVLSARTAAHVRVDAAEAGAQAYLSKPFQPAELRAVIKSQLDIQARNRRKYAQHATSTEDTIAGRFGGEHPYTQEVFRHIHEHLDDTQLSVEKLAEWMNTNRSHFQRKIKTLTGYSPSELIRTIRLERAHEMLKKKEGNVTEVAYATGFTSQSYFSRCFTDHFGYAPSQLPL